MKRSHLLEIAIAGGIGSAAVLGYLGFSLITSHPRRYSSSQSYEERLARMETRIELGQWLIVAAAALFLISLAVGLVIAFGIGPNWMAVRRRGRTVVGKIVHFPDGTTLADGDCMDAEGVRYYLRIRDPEGGVTEFACSPEQYLFATSGWTGTIRYLGRRLIALESGRR